MTNTPITASYNLSSTQSDQAGKAGCLLFGVAGAGKSTLIEHLPYSARSLFDDQLTLLNATELEQDTPANTTSHPALALFQANVALVIVDASLGLPDQCRQFIQQIALLGINELILAVNKMDLVGYSENTFLKLANDFQQLASQAGLENITAVPISALENVNVTETGKNLPWYQGRVLKDQLQQLQTKAVASAASTVKNARESHANQFESTIIWLNPQPLLPGRRYLLETGTQTTSATITTIKHRLNVGAPELLAAKKLDCSAAGVCNISVDQQIAFMPYQESHESGGFILIDAASNQLAGVGMLHFALRRAQNIHLHKLDVDKAARASKLGHQPCVLWFTGLSGSGKSTIANMAEKKLYAQGFHTYMLDGDNVRHGLNKDLGFTDADRVENIRRIAEVAKLMVDAGLIVLVAFISPFRSDRDRARELLQKGEFVEVFIDTPLTVAEERDPKGLYQKARKGELKNFTGIDSPYEPPLNPEIRIDTTVISADQAADLIVSRIQENNR